MTDTELLHRTIKQSGLKVVSIAEKMGRNRSRIYSILHGADCTASEITALSSILNLSRDERDQIFFALKRE